MSKRYYAVVSGTRARTLLAFDFTSKKAAKDYIETVVDKSWKPRIVSQGKPRVVGVQVK